MKRVIIFSPLCRSKPVEIIATGLRDLGGFEMRSNSDQLYKPDIAIDYALPTNMVDLIKYAESTDLIFYSGTPHFINSWDIALKEQLAFFKTVGKKEITAFIDDSDDAEPLEKDFFGCQRYLKREKWHSYRHYPNNIFAMPYCILPYYLRPARERIYEFSCMLKSYPNRHPYIELMQKLSKTMPARTDIADGGSSWNFKLWTGNRHNNEYLDILHASKLAVSLPGRGADTFRYWEILASGACLLSPPIEKLIEIPNPLVSGIHYIEFNTPAELEDVLLSPPSNWRQIASAGHEYAMKYHTAKARTLQVLVAMKYSLINNIPQ